MKPLAHLVDEGGKLVVEGLDLLALLSPHPLDGGVDLQVERSQETLVDGDLLDASRGAHREARATEASSNSTSIAKSTADSKPTTGPATKAASEAAAAPTDGDLLGPPQRLRLPKLAPALLILPRPPLPTAERATETELKRERPAAGVVAEVVLKPLRLPDWKVMEDCRDMVGEERWVSLCHPGWSTVADSWLTATFASQAEVILPPQLLE
ncbi:LOW QUALITY PROTEIN: hypothetical protein AAY473_018314 [Plecturocebus cupreus]